MKAKLSKRKREQLSPEEHLELSEYTIDERNEMFRSAIEDMAKRGILSASQAKEYLVNIDKWLLEVMEN